MAPAEIILSASSSEASGRSSSALKSAAAPAIATHDLLTASHLHSFKTSTSSIASTGYVPTRNHAGGAVFSVQEGKALLHIWAWQKDQMHLKVHLPEKMSCFAVSPNGCWAVAGSGAGQVYLWEMATGLLISSFTAHYRAVSTLTFSPDSHLLLSSSLDSSVHVYLVSRLVSLDEEGGAGLNSKPYGVLSDHTLAVRDVRIGRTAGAHGGRCWTASDDGTVKVWSLTPSFDLLTTFALPDKTLPVCVTVDASERVFYVGTDTGAVYKFELFRYTEGSTKTIETIGGNGLGSLAIKAEQSVISHASPISAISLSLTSTHLLVGTRVGEIHMHALPTHQLVRIIPAHAGAITHLSTLMRPPDFIGVTGVRSLGAAGNISEAYPLMEIKPFERQKAGRLARDGREVTMLTGLRHGAVDDLLEGLRPRRETIELTTRTSDSNGGDHSRQVADLENENQRLKANLEKALKANEKMWNGVVQMKLAEGTHR